MTEKTNAEWLREKAIALRTGMNLNPCINNPFLDLARKYEECAEEIETLQALITKDLGR